MKKLLLPALLCIANLCAQPVPEHYIEFQTAQRMINDLHTLLNATTIKVADGRNHFQGCNPHYNQVDQGIKLAFYDGHPDRLYTPFGEVQLVWNCTDRPGWKEVTALFLAQCKLIRPHGQPFIDGRGYRVIAYDGTRLPITRISLKNESSDHVKQLWTACQAYYKDNKGAVTDLIIHGKRLKQQALIAKESAKLQADRPSSTAERAKDGTFQE